MQRRLSRRVLIAVALLCALVPLPAYAQSPPVVAFVSAPGALVASIDVTGVRRISASIVIDQMISAVGEPFDAANLARDEWAIERLGVFSRIEVQPRNTSAGVALDVAVVEILPVMPYVSIKVSDQNGTSGGPGIRTVSFRGRPLKLALAMRFGAAQGIDFIGTTPWFTRQPRWTEFSFLQSNRPDSVNDFRENATELTVYRGTRLGNHTRIGALANLFTLGSDTDGKTIAGDNRDVTFRLGGLLRYDTRDETANASTGWWNEIEVGRTFGDGTRWTADVDIRRFQPIGPRQTAVLTGLLSLQSGDVGTDVPVYRQFALGGANTIRGWDVGENGGQHQLITTAEYRLDLIETRPFTVFGARFFGGVQLAAFGDLGSAWGDSSFDAGLIKGGGIGLRLIVPYVNVIRFDFAFGEPGAGMRGHFGLDEKSVAARMRIR